MPQEANPLAKLIKGMAPEDTLLFRQLIDKIVEHINAGRTFIIKDILTTLSQDEIIMTQE